MENPRLRAALFFPRRIVWAVLTLLIIPTLTFGALRYAMISETPYPPEMAERLGLDQPMGEQYIQYLGRLLQGDLGTSLTTRQPVTETIGQRLPATLGLVGLSLLVSVLLSALIVALGVLVLKVRARIFVVGSILQRLGQLVVAIVIAAPLFLLGIYLMWLFSVKSAWFPAAGFADRGSERAFDLNHAVLPMLTLAVLPACLTARAVLGEIVRFRSGPLGHRGRRVAHITLSFLENTLCQTVGLLGGTLLVESVFSLPGVGRLFIQAIQSRDLTVLHGLLYLFAVLTLILRGMAAVVHGIDGFILTPLQTTQQDAENQSPIEKPRYVKILAWLWIAFCVLLILVPVVRGLLGFVAGGEIPMQVNPADANLPPGSQSADGHIYAWGTDSIGRDLRSRVLYALGMNLVTSFAVALVVSIPGLIFGLLAGALVRRGALWADLLDDLLMFPWDVLASWPGLVLLVFLLALTEYSLLLLLICLGLAFILPRCVRMVRDGWRSGISQTSVWLRLIGVFLGSLASGVGLALVMQPTLGFIGLGVHPPTPELGSIIAEGLRRLFASPYAVLRPGWVLVSAALGWFLFADTILSKCGIHARGTWAAPNR
jgi:peptide/nickel transport system permease protein